MSRKPTAPPRPPRLSKSRPGSTPSSDDQRYHLFRSGVSAEEQAARENVRLQTIQRSIERMEARRQQYSLESVNQRMRERLDSQADVAFAALEEAMSAEDEPPKYDEAGNVVPVARPNWAVRLKAFREFKEAWAASQPKSPLVSVDARSQTQINNPGQQGQMGGGAPLSTESIIREIRASRGLALTSGEPAAATTIPSASAVPVFVEVDQELQEELAEEPAPEDTETGVEE